MSVFTYAIEVWACAYGSKYLSEIDKFCKRAWKYGYTKDRIVIDNVIVTRDKQLWEKITHTDTHCLTDLLQSKRTYQFLYDNVVMIIPYHAFAQSALSAVL